MQFTIIGNPENRRVTAFADTLLQMGHGNPVIISYADWLSGNAIALPQAGILKIDSPGENESVRNQLIALSGHTATQPAEHGSIQDMPYWYAGYSNWLQDVAAAIHARPGLQVVNQPNDIRLQFNKPQCQQWLQQQGVPVPKRLPAFNDYDELVAHMQEQRLHRVFIKPAHASSASGVVAFRKSGNRVQAVTSAEMVTTPAGLQLYNSLKVRSYTREHDIALLINRLVKEQVFAEEWLPKATLHDRYFDVRVLTIAGRARHMVVRTSKQVITNLHLGNQRGDWNTFVAAVGMDALQRIEAVAEQTAACFPNSLYMGIDILLTANLQQTIVLEINAFGDLLPGLLHEGETCYQAEINAMINKTRSQQPINNLTATVHGATS